MAIFISLLQNSHYNFLFQFVLHILHTPYMYMMQALEPESIIPLVMANTMTKIVLAGDHMQLDPPVYSPLARKYNLHLSLLERLYDHEAYDNGVGQLCKTLLTENHRSHQLVCMCVSQRDEYCSIRHYQGLVDPKGEEGM